MTILEEVPHRQYVFTIPKCLRIYFKYDRELLGDLSRGAYESLKELFRVAVPDEEATPGAITAIQTFGEMLNFHPHLHCLVTDGCFGKEGTFYQLPSLVDMDLLTDLFRHKSLPRTEGRGHRGPGRESPLLAAFWLPCPPRRANRI